MAITPEEISDDDRDLGLRILGYARPVAPCLQNIFDDDRATAIAILKSVAKRVLTTPAGVKARAAGDWSMQYFSDAELGGVFSVDDRAALRALCGASASAGRGPVGSFPESMDYGKVFR